MSVRLSFFGAAGCVTGACMLLETSAARVLIDCGLFQGPKTLKALNYGPFPFDAADVDAVLLTHAHIDHGGLLPKLMLAGFERAIYATQGTQDLCGVLLPDAGAIQEMEVEALNARNLRHGKPEVAPVFTKSDANACLDQFAPVDFKSWIDVAAGVRARWWNAGHILGAASIEVEVRDGEQAQTLLFSGDIGPGDRRSKKIRKGPPASIMSFSKAPMAIVTARLSMRRHANARWPRRLCRRTRQAGRCSFRRSRSSGRRSSSSTCWN